jgi:uncharacterized protein YkwD
MQQIPLNRAARRLILLSGATLLAIGSPLVIPASAAQSATAQSATAQTATTQTATASKRRARKPRPTATRPTPIASASDTQSLERAAHDQVNRYRASQGLPALAWNEAIAAQARNHSQSMAQGQTGFGHGGFDGRVKATGVSFSGAAENVAYNQGYHNPVDVAVDGWIKSPGHKSNMEGDYDTAGIGVARNAQGEIYFTQVFLRSR